MFVDIKHPGFIIAILSGIATFGFVIYYTVKILVKRSKYRHIVGPNTTGYIFI